MAGVNKVILIGNLGRDPELRYTQGGQPVCTLNLATTRTWQDRNGEKKEETEWHRVTVWGKQAEHCERYLSKGRQVYVEGRLQTRSYEDKEGHKKYATDIIAETVQFLSGGGERGERSHDGGDRPPRGGGGGGRGGSGGGRDSEPSFDDSYVPSDPGDDDIPF
jgi:single-strand DNA-binding protein